MVSDKARLYIFPPSSGCETITWLLQQYGIHAEINSQTAPFFQFAIQRAGGKTFPFLKYGSLSESGSLAISNALEEMLPADKRLYPTAAEQHEEARSLWSDFINPKLGAAVPYWAYYYLLPHRSLLRGPITKGVPWWQGLIVTLAYPLIAWMIGKSLGLTKEPPAPQEKAIREVFDRIDALLAEGRQYLVGERLSLVDIGFAAMAAPAVLEPGYGHGGLFPALESVPPEMQKVVAELRERPAGKFIARIYRDYR